MRLFSAPLVLLLGVASSWAADDGKTTSSSSDTTTGDATLKIISATGADVPTGPYQTYSSTIVLSTTAKDGEATSTTSTASGSGSDTASASGTATGNSTDASAHTTTSASLTMLVGGQGAGTTTLSGNATATGNSSMTSSSTSQTPLPTNTQPCNGYPEFCTRNYSNITMVAAHNSPFVRPGNWASNQALPVTTQLNDGIRMCKYNPRRKRKRESRLTDEKCNSRPTGRITPSGCATPRVISSMRAHSRAISSPSPSGCDRTRTTCSPF